MALTASVNGCAVGRFALRSFFAPRGSPLVVEGYDLLPGTWKPGHFLAGVARVDITPPPGYPTGGHGPAGAMARGYWTRLYARAFFFADAAGNPALFVSCDLFAVPAGLVAEVSRRVATTWAEHGLSIPPEAVVIAATHTHQGPGNYLSAAVYNQFGSKYSGFDRALFDFLIERIAAAANAAVGDALAYPTPASISIDTAQTARSILLNRSPRTFLTNWNAAPLMDRLTGKLDLPECVPTVEEGEARSDWDLAHCPRLRATDPTLSLLRIERDGRAIGAMVFLGVHPTVLDHHAPLNSSDFVGVAMAQAERESRTRNGQPYIMGFFNGAEGDIVARRGRRDVRDVVSFATGLRTAVDAVARDPRDAVPVPTIRTRRTTLEAGHEYWMPHDGVFALSAFPIFGAAALGGAEDDRTILRDLGWREGLTEIPSLHQGGKLPSLDGQLVPTRGVTISVAPPRSFPAQLPIGLIQLGRFNIGTIPVEMSIAQAATIRDSLGQHGYFELIGLANEYASYAATPDEYERQDYMAASTILGPQEGPAIAQALRCLSRADTTLWCAKDRRRPDTAAHLDPQVFWPGKPPNRRLQFGPRAVGEPLSAVDDELSSIVRDASGAPARNLPAFEWSECVDTLATDFDAAARRTVSILERGSYGWIPRVLPGIDSETDDDEGVNFITLGRSAPALGRVRNERRYAALWLAPILESTVPQGEYKFQVEIRDRRGQISRRIESPSFRVDLDPKTRATTPYAPAACQDPR